MSNRHAVSKIVHDYIASENRKNKVYLKWALYSMAFLGFLYCCYLGKLGVGILIGLGFSCLIVAFFGLPSDLMNMSMIRDEVVPDAIYVALKESQEIDPELLNVIRSHMSSRFTVGQLVNCESEYYRAKAVVTAPGYSALLGEKVSDA